MESTLRGFLKIKISVLMDHLHTSTVPVDVIESGVELSLPCRYGVQMVKGDSSQLISTHAAFEFTSSGACFRLAQNFFGIFCLKRQRFFVNGVTSTLDLAGSAPLWLVLVIGIYVTFILHTSSFSSGPRKVS